MLLLGIDTEFFKDKVSGWLANGGMTACAEGQDIKTADEAWLAFTQAASRGLSEELKELKAHFLKHCFADLSTAIMVQLLQYTGHRSCNDTDPLGLDTDSVWNEVMTRLDKGLVAVATEGCVLAAYICPGNVSAQTTFESFLWARDSRLSSVVVATMDTDGPIAWPTSGKVWLHDVALLAGQGYTASDLGWYLTCRLVSQLDLTLDSLPEAIMALVDRQPSLCGHRFPGLDEQTLLHRAATMGSLVLVNALITAGADVGALDTKGRTAHDLAHDPGGKARLVSGDAYV